MAHWIRLRCHISNHPMSFSWSTWSSQPAAHPHFAYEGPLSRHRHCVCGQMNGSSLMALCSLLWLQIMCQHYVLGIVRKDLCEQSNWWKVNIRYSHILTVLLVCKTIIVQIYIMLLCKYRPSSIRLVQIRVSCSEIRGIFNHTLGTKW